MNRFDEFKYKEALFMCNVKLKEESSSPEALLIFMQQFLDDVHPVAIQIGDAMKIKNSRLNFTNNLIVLYNSRKDEGYNHYPILHCNISKLTNVSMENILISYPKFAKSKELFAWVGLEKGNSNFNSLLKNYSLTNWL